MWAFCNDPAVRRAIHAEPIEKIGSFDECELAALLRCAVLCRAVLRVSRCVHRL